MTPQIEELTYEAWGLAPSRLVAGTLPEMPSSRVVGGSPAAPPPHPGPPQPHPDVPPGQGPP
ncbi:hypothetical protein AB0G58_33135, partial [Streptomyces sp. NPDC022067]